MWKSFVVLCYRVMMAICFVFNEIIIATQSHTLNQEINFKISITL